WVTWRAQPPFWMRRGALLKDDHASGMPPTSVAGGDTADGNWLESAGFCGPGSVMLCGLALIAPCGGRLGLPKVCAAACAAAPATEPAAVAASRPRREMGVITISPGLPHHKGGRRPDARSSCRRQTLPILPWLAILAVKLRA